MNIIAGLLTGLTASMGLGGGFILLIYLSIFTDTPQAVAQGINILFFLPIAFVSLIIHAKNKLIDWKTVGIYTITGVIGAILGSIAASMLDTSLLRKLFGIFLVIIGLRELFFSGKKSDRKDRRNN